MKQTLYVILSFLLIYANPAFGAVVSSGVCLAAPAPLLQVGDTGVVLIDGLNLRALPAVETGVSGRLYKGNRFTVIGGSSCNGSYTWWRVETANGTRGWLAEGTIQQYYVVPSADADQPPMPVHITCLLTLDPVACL